MATNVLRPGFTAGELDPKVLRPDMEQYHYGARKMRNVYVQPQGGFRRRPGSTKQAEVKKLKLVEEIAASPGQTVFEFLLTLDLTLPAPFDTFTIYYESVDGEQIELTDKFIGDLFYQSSYATSPDKLTATVSPTLIVSTGDKLILVVTSGPNSEVDLDLPADAVREFKFSFSEDQEYVFVFAPYTLSIYKEIAGLQTRQVILFIPISSENIPGISFAQQLDTMIIFHKDIVTQEVQRQGSDVDWKIAPWAYENIPKRNFIDTNSDSTGFEVGVNHEEKLRLENFNDGDDFTIFVDGEETDGIEFNLSANVATDHRISLFNRQAPGTTFTFTLTVFGETTIETTGLITYDSAILTTAANIQTALQALPSLSTVTCVFVSGGGGFYGPSGFFDIEFVGADGGKLWYVRDDSLTDDDIPDISSGQETTQIGYPLKDQSIENITEAIVALDTTDGIPLVRRQTTSAARTIYTIEMLNNGDEKRLWTFLEGVEDFNLGNNLLRFITETKGSQDLEDVWSQGGDTPRGFPRCGAFHQGALYVAGGRDLPQTLWRSRIGNVKDFDNSNTEDDFGFEVDGDTNTVSAFVAINPGRHLQIFSTEAEFYIPVNTQSAPITPLNVTLRRTTRIGSKEGVGVIETDGAVIFLSEEGKSLREFLFTDSEVAYSSNVLSGLSAHLLDTPSRMAYKSTIDLDNTNYIYLANTDGSLIVINIQRGENVNAWTLSTTQGLYRDITVLSENTYYLVQRNLNGSDTVLLEKSDENALLDASISATGVLVTEVTSGLGYLEGELVSIILDGNFHGTDTVTSGEIQFTDFKGDPLTVSSWEIGLALPVVDGGDGHTWVQTLNGALQSERGTTLGQEVQVSEVDFAVLNTQTLRVRHDADQIFAAVDQITQMDFVGFVNADTYKLLVNGETTGTITYSTTLGTQTANITAALEALVQIDSGDVAVTDLAGASDQIVLSFQNGASGTLFDMTPTTLTGVGVLSLTDQATGAPAKRPRDNVVSFQNLGSSLLDETDVGFSGNRRVEGLLGWSRTGQVSFTQSVPGKMNVTNVVLKVEI